MAGFSGNPLNPCNPGGNTDFAQCLRAILTGVAKSLNLIQNPTWTTATIYQQGFSTSGCLQEDTVANAMLPLHLQRNLNAMQTLHLQQNPNGTLPSHLLQNPVANVTQPFPTSALSRSERKAKSNRKKIVLRERRKRYRLRKRLRQQGISDGVQNSIEKLHISETKSTCTGQPIESQSNSATTAVLPSKTEVLTGRGATSPPDTVVEPWKISSPLNHFTANFSIREKRGLSEGNRSVDELKGIAGKGEKNVSTGKKRVTNKSKKLKILQNIPPFRGILSMDEPVCMNQKQVPGSSRKCLNSPVTQKKGGDNDTARKNFSTPLSDSSLVTTEVSSPRSRTESASNVKEKQFPFFRKSNAEFMNKSSVDSSKRTIPQSIDVPNYNSSERRGPIGERLDQFPITRSESSINLLGSSVVTNSLTCLGSMKKESLQEKSSTVSEPAIKNSFSVNQSASSLNKISGENNISIFNTTLIKSEETKVVYKDMMEDVNNSSSHPATFTMKQKELRRLNTPAMQDKLEKEHNSLSAVGKKNAWMGPESRVKNLPVVSTRSEEGFPKGAWTNPVVQSTMSTLKNSEPIAPCAKLHTSHNVRKDSFSKTPLQEDNHAPKKVQSLRPNLVTKKITEGEPTQNYIPGLEKPLLEISDSSRSTLPIKGIPDATSLNKEKDLFKPSGEKGQQNKEVSKGTCVVPPSSTKSLFEQFSFIKSKSKKKVTIRPAVLYKESSIGKHSSRICSEESPLKTSINSQLRENSSCEEESSIKFGSSRLEPACASKKRPEKSSPDEEKSKIHNGVNLNSALKSTESGGAEERDFLHRLQSESLSVAKSQRENCSSRIEESFIRSVGATKNIPSPVTPSRKTSKKIQLEISESQSKRIDSSSSANSVKEVSSKVQQNVSSHISEDIVSPVTTKEMTYIEKLHAELARVSKNSIERYSLHKKEATTGGLVSESKDDFTASNSEKELCSGILTDNSIRKSNKVSSSISDKKESSNILTEGSVTKSEKDILSTTNSEMILSSWLLPKKSKSNSSNISSNNGVRQESTNIVNYGHVSESKKDVSSITNSEKKGSSRVFPEKSRSKCKIISSNNSDEKESSSIANNAIVIKSEKDVSSTINSEDKGSSSIIPEKSRSKCKIISSNNSDENESSSIANNAIAIKSEKDISSIVSSERKVSNEIRHERKLNCTSSDSQKKESTQIPQDGGKSKCAASATKERLNSLKRPLSESSSADKSQRHSSFIEESIKRTRDESECKIEDKISSADLRKNTSSKTPDSSQLSSTKVSAGSKKKVETRSSNDLVAKSSLLAEDQTGKLPSLKRESSKRKCEETVNTLEDIPSAASEKDSSKRPRLERSSSIEGQLKVHPSVKKDVCKMLSSDSAKNAKRLPDEFSLSRKDESRSNVTRESPTRRRIERRNSSGNDVSKEKNTVLTKATSGTGVLFPSNKNELSDKAKSAAKESYKSSYSYKNDSHVTLRLIERSEERRSEKYASVKKESSRRSREDCENARETLRRSKNKDSARSPRSNSSKNPQEASSVNAKEKSDANSVKSIGFNIPSTGLVRVKTEPVSNAESVSSPSPNMGLVKIKTEPLSNDEMVSLNTVARSAGLVTVKTEVLPRANEERLSEMPLLESQSTVGEGSLAVCSAKKEHSCELVLQSPLFIKTEPLETEEEEAYFSRPDLDSPNSTTSTIIPYLPEMDSPSRITDTEEELKQNSEQSRPLSYLESSNSNTCTTIPFLSDTDSPSRKTGTEEELKQRSGQSRPLSYLESSNSTAGTVIPFLSDTDSPSRKSGTEEYLKQRSGQSRSLSYLESSNSTAGTVIPFLSDTDSPSRKSGTEEELKYHSRQSRPLSYLETSNSTACTTIPFLSDTDSPSRKSGTEEELKQRSGQSRLVSSSECNQDNSSSDNLGKYRGENNIDRILPSFFSPLNDHGTEKGGLNSLRKSCLKVTQTGSPLAAVCPSTGEMGAIKADVVDDGAHLTADSSCIQYFKIDVIVTCGTSNLKYDPTERRVLCSHEVPKDPLSFAENDYVEYESSSICEPTTPTQDEPSEDFTIPLAGIENESENQFSAAMVPVIKVIEPTTLEEDDCVNKFGTSETSIEKHIDREYDSVSENSVSSDMSISEDSVCSNMSISENSISDTNIDDIVLESLDALTDVVNECFRP